MPDRPVPGLVSIIVPCFNTAEYLDDCLESLVGQTYPTTEIIAVDDGSTDVTPNILEAWQQRDRRIAVIRQGNRGLGAARNRGLDRASGEFLTFVDSDDVLPIDALDRMVGTLERTGSDFVTGVANRFDGQRTWRASLYRRGFREDLDGTHVFERPSLLNDHIICSKLFRRSFWDDHDFRFPEAMLFEDIEIATRAHCSAAAVDIIAEPTYLWRVRPAHDVSITQDRSRPGAVAQRFEALGRVDEYLRETAPPNVWRRHGLKVLKTDIPLYLREIERADDEFMRELVAAAGRFLRGCSPQAIDQQGPLPRRLIDALKGDNHRSVRALALIMGPRSTRTIRTRLTGVRLLTWSDRWWLLGVAVRLPWSRARRRLRRQRR